MSEFTSTEITGRIEALYGVPLAGLAARAQHQPPGMLSALLGMQDDLAHAERSIAFQRERLAQLIAPERQTGVYEVSHILDCARRLAEAVAVRDVQATATTAVLKSLGRVRPPGQSTAPVPAVPVPAASAAGSTRSR